MAVTPYFDNFPKIPYDIDGTGLTTESVTNIFHRFGILKDVISNAGSYVLYEIEENDTPEIIAEKAYDDAGAGWIILYANKIIDPQFDWPLNDDAFRKFITQKYGSIANAQSTYHHYEKVVETRVGDTTYTRTYLVNKERLTHNALDVPYTYYQPYSGNMVLTVDTEYVTSDNTMFTADHSNHFSYDDTSLPEYFSYESHDVNDKTVFMNTYGKAVSNYDYEYDLNESKRYIKVIKKQYYNQIIREFNRLTAGTPSYIRTI